MGRNLVLCFDGTNNQYAVVNTNVVKLYSMLDRTGSDQLAYYQPGIGTSAPPGMWGHLRGWLVTRIDLAVAWLLSDHVTTGYRYLMRYYQEGDRVFIFGFSRGAYTARALGGMLHKVGLLSQGNEELIPFAWDVYKRKDNFAVARGFCHTFGRRVPIHFMGLWDTVSSVGWMWNPSTLPYTTNNPSVMVVRHAIALDERRAYFRQNLWGETEDSVTNCLQVWFPGVHCDVGGGYAERESGLSKLALRWMIGQARAFGLQIQPKMEKAMLPAKPMARSAAPDPGAPQHESLRRWWWIVEFIPKRIRFASAQFKTRWIIPLGRPRSVASGARLHCSVRERMEQVSTYRPKNLPAVFQEEL